MKVVEFPKDEIICDQGRLVLNQLAELFKGGGEVKALAITGIVGGMGFKEAFFTKDVEHALLGLVHDLASSIDAEIDTESEIMGRIEADSVSGDSDMDEMAVFDDDGGAPVV